MKSSFDLRTHTGVYRAAALLCVFLIFLVGFVAVAHLHSGNSATPDHSCSLCALAHAGVVPLVLNVPAPILVSSAMLDHSPEISPSLLLVSTLYIRPPPIA
jgi:hypothetical protein